MLSNYMKTRMDRKSIKEVHKDYGPVVTISRAYGCPGKIVAQDLAFNLNKRLIGTHAKHWKWISKEILDESARELKLNKYSVREAVHANKKGVMDDLIISLANKFYPSDAKVKQTLADVIKGFAKEGNVIIVGRAGVSLTRSIHKSLHIRLQAPVEWRIKIVSERQNIPIEEARRKLLEIDYKRNHLREYYEGMKPDDSIFDIIFNYQTMNEEEILESIIKVMELKKLI
jgi:cytidylate kinase